MTAADGGTVRVDLLKTPGEIHQMTLEEVRAYKNELRAACGLPPAPPRARLEPPAPRADPEPPPTVALPTGSDPGNLGDPE